MNRKDYIDKIAKYLARFVEEVKSYNDMGLYDVNIHSENALIPILNAVFDLKLVNANATSRKNFPAVDLIDETNRVAFQITTTASTEKVKHTLEKFTEHKLYQRFSTLYIYIVSEKENKYSDKTLKNILPGNFDFDIGNHIIDISDLRTRINYIESLERLAQIARICEEQFSDIQQELRKKKFQQGYLKNEPEKLYPNFLKLQIPQTIYLADLNINDDEIKERINEWRLANGYRKKKSFSKESLFKSERIHKKVYFQDYILREGKLITFRDLYDIKEPFAQFIDSGTITPMNSEEYYETNEDYLRNFKYLLRQSLIELCKTKELEWIKQRQIFRFKNNRDMPNTKQIRWKGKNESTKTVIFEINNKEKGHVICFRSMAFRPSFELFGKEWILVINPTWSFTNPGGVKPTRFEKDYMSGLKRQENNNAVYYQYRFFGYYLSYRDLFSSQNEYRYLKIAPYEPFDFMPRIDEIKWQPPKEFAPQNTRESELKIDSELSKLLFD